MAVTRSGDDPVAAELRELRTELAELRSEVRAVAGEVDQLNRTFRSLTTQLGIAAEPYQKGAKASGTRDLPGFA